MNSDIVNSDIETIIGTIQSWMFLKNKTVLITGANGFIPAYMVETIACLNANYNSEIRLIALVRSEDKARKRFSHLLGQDWFNLLVQDVCEPLVVDENINFIIHAASQASPKFYGVDPVGTLLANTLGTYNVLECARKSKDSIEGVLFFSSAEIYGDVSSCPDRVSEDFMGPIDCLALRSCYAESKRIGETMCTSWFQQYQVPVKVIRIFHTYGPGMDLNDGRVFADFVRNVIQNNDIDMKSDGLAVRAFSYLSDTVSAAFKVLSVGANGEAYNVGNDNCAITMYDLACLLARISNSVNIRVRRIKSESNIYLASSVNKIVPDTNKIRSLGWKPLLDLESGFSRTIEYYK